MKPSKILVPTDFSECADNALRAAIHLAKRMDSSVIVFHAIQSAVYNQSAEAFIEVAADEDKTAEAFKKLIGRIPELEEVRYETEAVTGTMSQEVANMVRSVNADLVVMGTKGASGINEVLMGSNTYRILQALKVPVLVIPERSSVKMVSAIALAGDYKPVRPEVLEPVKMMAHLNGAEIHIVHVDEESSLEEDEMLVARNLDHYLKDYHHHYHMINSDDVENGLKEYCEDNHIDLLAMIPRKHSLFDRIFGGGETKNMVYHTKIPLLAIPE